DEAKLPVIFAGNPVVGGVVGQLGRAGWATVLQQGQYRVDDRFALCIRAIGQVLGEQTLLDHIAIGRLTVARDKDLDLPLLAGVLDRLRGACRHRSPHAQDAAKIGILLQNIGGDVGGFVGVPIGRLGGSASARAPAALWSGSAR